MRLFSPGVGHKQILPSPRIGYLLTPGPHQSFLHVHGFLSEFCHTEDYAGKTSRLAHLSRTAKNLWRVARACSLLHACISSLLINPELHNEIGSYRGESMFFMVTKSNQKRAKQHLKTTQQKQHLKQHYSTVRSTKNVAVLTEDGPFALFFLPHPGGFESSRVPIPGNLTSKTKKKY